MKSLRLVTKLTLTISLLLVVAFGVGIFSIYYQTKTATEDSIAQLNENLAERIAKQIDVESYKSVLQNKEQDDTYWKIRNQLNDLRKQTGSLYVYTVAYYDGSPRIMIDGQDKDAENASKIGDKTSTTTYEMIEPVLNGHTSSTDIIIDKTWGNYLSSFAPIKDANGKVIGILGVDTAADVVGDITDNIISKNFPYYLGIIAIFFVLSVVFSIWYINHSLRPLEQIELAVEDIANKDLFLASKRMDRVKVRMDDIGRLQKAVIEMIRNLNMVLYKVSESTSSTDSLADKVKKVSNDVGLSIHQTTDFVNNLAEGLAYQVSTSKETSVASNEIAHGIAKISENITLASEGSKEALNEAQNGYLQMQSVIEQIGKVKDLMDETSKSIMTMSSRSREIEEVLGTITDIAKQTNLLSLNASIEAARAGEHGKGFAVVSNEIRKLAEQSRKSAEQIAGLIKSIHKDTAASVNIIEAGVKESYIGLEMIQTAGEEFKLIVSKNNEVASEIEEISTAAQQITASTEEVASSVDEVANIANVSSAESEKVKETLHHLLVLLEEAKESSNTMDHSVKELTTILKMFNLCNDSKR